MEELYGEARWIMRYFHYGHLTSDEELIGEVVSAILRAEHDWVDDGRCEMRSFRMTYAKNAVRTWLRNRMSVRNSFNRKMKSITPDIKDNGRPVKNKNIDDEKIRMLLAKIDTSERNKGMIYDIYFLSMTQQEVASKHGIDKRRVQQIVYNVLNKVRKVAKKEDLLC